MEQQQRRPYESDSLSGRRPHRYAEQELHCPQSFLRMLEKIYPHTDVDGGYEEENQERLHVARHTERQRAVTLVI
ncbi:unnamed protein product [Nesidiocoris tenuis]|uniref:Uncharacterized protein n=1 Tax=Nesidiocoris tenuis TaxID=355587 RepID=A0A6H5FXA6_9HEMI|nr:unnamed protein product [Nesidiocoris tenuis]